VLLLDVKGYAEKEKISKIRRDKTSGKHTTTMKKQTNLKYCVNHQPEPHLLA
jgi:putative ribosome biogenesis GTPase RsgA